jgi:hypothetical protein
MCLGAGGSGLASMLHCLILGQRRVKRLTAGNVHAIRYNIKLHLHWRVVFLYEGNVILSAPEAYRALDSNPRERMLYFTTDLSNQFAALRDLMQSGTRMWHWTPLNPMMRSPRALTAAVRAQNLRKCRMRHLHSPTPQAAQGVTVSAAATAATGPQCNPHVVSIWVYSTQLDYQRTALALTAQSSWRFKS